MSLESCFSLSNQSTNPLRVFNQAVADSTTTIDGGECAHLGENLLDLEGVIKLVTKHNYEVIPFLKYIRANHAGKHKSTSSAVKKFT